MAKKTKKITLKGATKKAEEPLTKIEEKRVAIAKDALAQIKAEKYSVRAGYCYVELDNDSEELLQNAANSSELFTGKKAKELELNKFLDKLITPSKPCTICAKGGLFLSAVRKYNDCSIQQAADNDLDSLAQDIGNIFGDENANTIEDYFEKNDPMNENGDKWSHLYPHATERLIVILKNVIANRGQFVPSKLKGYIEEEVQDNVIVGFHKDKPNSHYKPCLT